MVNYPVVVDLDGTLVYTDMLHELAVKLLAEKPLKILLLPCKLMHGKARLKQYIKTQTEFSANLLPYNESLLKWLKVQKLEGRHLVLCTASDRETALPIADHIGLFDEVMASDGHINLSGKNKASALVAKFGKGQFDYCGNAAIDLQVWEHANSAIVVNASDKLVQKAKRIAPVSHVVSRPKIQLETVMQAVHAYRWMLNLFIFIPVLILQKYWDLQNVMALTYGSFAVYLFASTIPVIRDLLSLEKDRSDSLTKTNPFASGKISILFGVVIILVALSFILLLILKMLIIAVRS